MSILNPNKKQVYRVVGISFDNEDGSSRQYNLSRVNAVSDITLVREPNNIHDPNAVAVYADGRQVGYIGNFYAALIAPRLDAGEKFDVKINQYGLYYDKYILHIEVSPKGGNK